jgi:predicted trehalose synthase
MSASERCWRALEAASEIGRRLGAGAVTPRLLAEANNISIRLDPLPIVARVFSTGPFRADVAALGREVAIGRHLAARNAPVVPPATELPAGPHVVSDVVGDLAVTLWTWMPHRAARADDSNEAAAALRALHAALIDFPEGLPTLATQFEQVRAMVAAPSATPALAHEDRAFLLDAHQAIVARLASLGGPSRPVHGDAHLGNVLMAQDGARWTDFEAACIAPAEWDLALLPDADPAVLGPMDPDLARVMRDLRSLGVAVWCAAQFDQADKREAATYHLDRLRERAATGFR